MGLAESVFGTPGTTDFIKSGGSQASPGYNFAKSFYSWLPSLMQQQYPTYQGQIDPGVSPTMQDAIRRSQGYAQSGPAEILQGVQGTLGNFMSPNFLNPWNAMMGGNPNYGGVNPMQRIYGGQPASNFGGFAGGSPGMGVPPGQMPRPSVPPMGGQGFVAGEPAPGTGGSIPPMGGSQGAAPAGGFGQAINMGFNDAQGAISRMFQGNSQGLNSALAGQYGMNQYGQQNDGRQQFMHSTDHVSALQRILGREPTFDEVQQSLRSGPGNIEAARSLFMQDAPGGSADWGAGQKSYANLVDQYGLAKGGQMFEQEFGSGPMWAGGQPGGAPSSIPPMGGPPSGPIVNPAVPKPMPSTPSMPNPPHPMNGASLPPMGGGVSATRPGALPSAPASIPPMGSSGAGATPTMPGTVDPMNGPIRVAPSKPMAGAIPPMGSASTPPKPGQTYGGYTEAELQANPALKDRLGNAARRRLGMPATGPTDLPVMKPIKRQVNPRP